MGEVNGDFDGRLTTAFTGGHDDGDDDERVHEWEIGLPNVDDITPLTQGLIPPELLSAFNIKPEPYRTSGEVTQASEDTLSLLRGTNFKAFCDDDDESETKKQRRNDSPEDADSAAAEDGGSGGGDGGDGGGGGCEKAVKRARLVWTPQLHKRFVDVVAHLGIKNAVPKTIMQLMNVEGLTRENVASHLQKYRLYLKRMQGGSFDGGSNSSSENNGNGNGNGNNGNGAMSVPVMPMGMMGMGMMGYTGFESNYNHNHNHSHQQNNNNNNNNNGSHYSNGNSNHNHNNHHQMYSNGNNGMMMMQSGNKYGSVMSYHHSPHVGPSEN